MNNNILGYEGKNVAIIGGATGMGAAAAKIVAGLGASIYVMDVAEVTYPVAASIKLDLRSAEAIDRAVAELPQRIDTVFCCAGVADGFPGIMLINFIGQRYLLDQLLASGKLGRGGAIVGISSVAGLPWMQNQQQVFEFLDCRDWDSATSWISAHEGTDSYGFSKQAWNGYVAREALGYLKRGVRINAILPGPTDTPLARANADVWLGFGTDFRAAAGVEAHTPEQMGNALAFLGSSMSYGINGQTLLVDHGHVIASMTGAWDDPLLSSLGA
ncbi:SDR family oxidoreductase [Pseudomaricurvus alcaniphilus]|uniref:SDR family oxidoreductase n=1 Tax=Pseudomaricurvus alcaniphilus TaxID=1166482 RepID=UPI0014080109|nr:SDR family oxidoreductase [Pseudomaricurvus alcaniphilus]NHN38296.1 SDR family oxidoreductase [Pseudomaricurvus alcaniphilus]